MSFYIEKIIVTGSGKTDSIIELSNGVNIIYGPSNTGKTYIVKCIDYMFGSEREPIDISTGYQYIKIIVRTQCGTITMSRKIGENKIEVSSNDNNVPSGKYATKASRTNYDKTINSVWLSLIGINDLHLVISNENYKKQILSWRTFSHMFMLTETKIISEYSAILSGRDTSNTAVIASLIFLLSGQDFAETETKDTKEIKEAKKNAVKAYINKELFRLSERNQELLAQSKENPNIDIAVEIEKIMAEISTNEKRINSSIEENQKILAQLYEKNENLSECNVLLNRYDELTTQYDADLKRLNFIVDGEANLNASFSTHCPFCDGEVVVKKNQNYIDAAKSDYKKIKLQAKDLESASKELRSEKLSLEQEIGTLMAKKKSIEKLIEKELKPQVFNLKEKLSTYKDAIECQKEIDILKKLSEQKTADMIENDTDEESELKFKVKEHLDYSFINELSNGIKSFLENCNYDNLLSVIFDKADMDIVINGKKKSSNGKGYNAYFNSVVAIVLSRYMENKAKYSPDFLVLDSPILSLKEKETKKPSETMRNTLFENIVDNQKGIQTIVIENEIPEINYKDANIIHFTKEKNNGRYGFLLDVAD
nr:AAA family ATPase [Mediterraneibacter faecis]